MALLVILRNYNFMAIYMMKKVLVITWKKINHVFNNFYILIYQVELFELKINIIMITEKNEKNYLSNIYNKNWIALHISS
jgi:hypothetical protein